jgi:RNA polymerase sigma factor (sigma-70 family)
MSTLYQLTEGYPLLPDAEQKDLARRAKAGDIEARNKLVLHNLRLVISIIKPRMTEENVDDLFQNASEYLVRCIEKYDPESGYSFTTLATYWIQLGARLQLYHDHRKAYVPRYMYDRLQEVKKYQERGITSAYDLSQVIGIAESTTQRILDYQHMRYVSMDRLVMSDGHETDLTIGDLIPSEVDCFAPLEEQDAQLERKNHVRRLLRALTDREKEVICCFYGIGREQQSIPQIADEMGVSRQRVLQLRNSALKRLKKTSGLDRMPEGLAS